MIDQALLRNSTNGDGSHSSHGDNRRNIQTARPCFYADFMKYQPLNFKGAEGMVGLTQWIEKMESVFNISGCAVENSKVFHLYSCDNNRKADDSSRNNHGHQQRPLQKQICRQSLHMGDRLKEQPLLGSLPKCKQVPSPPHGSRAPREDVNAVRVLRMEKTRFKFPSGMNFGTFHGNERNVCNGERIRVDSVYLHVQKLKSTWPRDASSFEYEYPPRSGGQSQKDEREHEEHLKAILKLLKKEKLYAKFLKCEFWIPKVLMVTIEVHRLIFEIAKSMRKSYQKGSSSTGEKRRDRFSVDKEELVQVPSNS
ncbi:hypothetical protein Tco_1402276 [Tanacetum coccineum]